MHCGVEVITTIWCVLFITTANSDYFLIQHWVTGFYNRDGQCLLRGTDWMFIYNSRMFCPHSVFVCFVWISEQIAIISLFNINWLVFITETVCVYCAVRTECLHIIQIPLKPSGHYMYHQFNIHQFYVLPTQCIYVFCVDLRTNSDYFSIQH
jgi:hypothetical protein